MARTMWKRTQPSRGEHRAERSNSTGWFDHRASSLSAAGFPWSPEIPGAPCRHLRPRVHHLALTHPGRPAASITLASVTSLDHTSYCHLRRPRTPQRTRPVCSPTRMFRSTSVASATDLQQTRHEGGAGPSSTPVSSPMQGSLERREDGTTIPGHGPRWAGPLQARIPSSPAPGHLTVCPCQPLSLPTQSNPHGT